MDMGINKIANAAVSEAAPVAPAPPIGRKGGGAEVGLANAKTGSGKEPAPEKVEKAASDVQSHFTGTNTQLRIEVDSRSKQVIVKIIDSQSNEVIRQIPSEELLAIKERLGELVGVLYDSKS